MARITCYARLRVASKKRTATNIIWREAHQTATGCYMGRMESRPRNQRWEKNTENQRRRNQVPVFVGHPLASFHGVLGIGTLKKLQFLYFIGFL